ncbi:histidinol-phosphatase [hydrocarbon metagenome]|uniref:histidinol-phosphatase n=1 Tax=hydrocarbon metagenome TaxID=938273 RepID=A0A0W8E8G7_9ZZZZ
MLLDYHIHALAHGEHNYSMDWLEQFLNTARSRQLIEIGFTEHDEFSSRIDFKLLERIRQENDDIAVKIGLEVDYWEGREKQISLIMARYPYDYVIGSIHYIDGWAFDHPDHRDGFEQMDIDEIYRHYFEIVNSSVKSGLFTIIGHIDLVKKWGHRPFKHNVNNYIKDVLNSIKKSDLTVEINSAGLRKPVAQIYPAREILEIMAGMKIPITLCSDAHHPSEVGAGIRQAAHLAWAAGYREIAAFNRGRRIMLPLVL